MMPLITHQLQQQCKYHFRVLIGLFLLLISQNCWASTLSGIPLRLTSDSITKIELQDWVYANQSNDIENLTTLLQRPENSWKKIDTNQPYKIGIKNYWVSFSIFNPNDHLSRIIALDNPLLDSVKIYHLINGE